jgi:hypothetical protein
MATSVEHELQPELYHDLVKAIVRIANAVFCLCSHSYNQRRSDLLKSRAKELSVPLPSADAMSQMSQFSDRSTVLPSNVVVSDNLSTRSVEVWSSDLEETSRSSASSLNLDPLEDEDLPIKSPEGELETDLENGLESGAHDEVEMPSPIVDSEDEKKEILPVKDLEDELESDAHDEVNVISVVSEPVDDVLVLQPSEEPFPPTETELNASLVQVETNNPQVSIAKDTATKVALLASGGALITVAGYYGWNALQEGDLSFLQSIYSESLKNVSDVFTMDNFDAYIVPVAEGYALPLTRATCHVAGTLFAGRKLLQGATYNLFRGASATRRRFFGAEEAVQGSFGEWIEQQKSGWGKAVSHNFKKDTFLAVALLSTGLGLEELESQRNLAAQDRAAKNSVIAQLAEGRFAELQNRFVGWWIPETSHSASSPMSQYVQQHIDTGMDAVRLLRFTELKSRSIFTRYGCDYLYSVPGNLYDWWGGYTPFADASETPPSLLTIDPAEVASQTSFEYLVGVWNSTLEVAMDPVGSVSTAVDGVKNYTINHFNKELDEQYVFRIFKYIKQ